MLPSQSVFHRLPRLYYSVSPSVVCYVTPVRLSWFWISLSKSFNSHFSSSVLPAVCHCSLLPSPAILFTTSIPSVTLPKAAYAPSRCGEVLCMMKTVILPNRMHCTRHRKNARFMLQIICKTVLLKFSFDTVSRATHFRFHSGIHPGS